MTNVYSTGVASANNSASANECKFTCHASFIAVFLCLVYLLLLVQSVIARKCACMHELYTHALINHVLVGEVKILCSCISP